MAVCARAGTPDCRDLSFTVRPARARAEKPKISALTTAKIDRVLAFELDCVFGFCDLQADIAASLIRSGIQVTIFNPRSIIEILSMRAQVAAIVRQPKKGQALIAEIRASMQAIAMQTQALDRAGIPGLVVFFEEWDQPHICAIGCVSDLIALAGGVDRFAELGKVPLGRDRIIADDTEIIARNPDIIIGFWCGKKFRPETVASRPGWESIAAVRINQLYEIKSPDILQPGPAALTDGLRHLYEIIFQWRHRASLGAGQ